MELPVAFYEIKFKKTAKEKIHRILHGLDIIHLLRQHLHQQKLDEILPHGQ